MIQQWRKQQAVCNAQGYLQLLPRFPNNPYTVFDLLDLDPNVRHLSSSRNSRGLKSKWHQKVQYTVDMVLPALEQAVHGQLLDACGRRSASSIATCAPTPGELLA